MTKPIAYNFTINSYHPFDEVNKDNNLFNTDLNPFKVKTLGGVEDVEKLKKQFNRDFAKKPYSIIIKNTTGEVNIATNPLIAKNIIDEKHEMPYDNIYNVLKETYKFSDDMAKLCLEQYAQGGVAGASFLGSGLNGSRMILEINDNNIVTLKTSKSEFPFLPINMYEESDNKKHENRTSEDLCKDVCPTEGDILINLSIVLGNITDVDLKNKQPNINVTLASNSQDGINRIKAFKNKAAKQEKICSQVKDFKQEQDICLAILGATTPVKSIVEYFSSNMNKTLTNYNLKVKCWDQVS